MRGRSRNKGPNPLTRSYESNGPDVKIRGTAQHVADKYSQLARDAQASGDPVAAENYLQHAEHYYRLIATAQEQYKQQFGGFQRDEDGEEGDEEFGGPAERGQGGEEYGDIPPPPQGGYDRGAQVSNQGPNQTQNRYDRGGDRQNQNRQRFDRNGERYGQGTQDRGGQERNQDRGERGYQGGADRGQGGYEPRQGGYDRPNGAEPRYDRQNGYDRPERQDRPDRPERRERFGRDDRPRDDRGAREGFGPREARPDRGDRRDAHPIGYGAGDVQAEDESNLPAFLTTPVRPAASVDDVAEDVGLAPSAGASDEAEAIGIRPRRRRARKADQAPEGADEKADGG